MNFEGRIFCAIPLSICLHRFCCTEYRTDFWWQGSAIVCFFNVNLSVEILDPRIYKLAEFDDPDWCVPDANRKQSISKGTNYHLPTTVPTYLLRDPYSTTIPNPAYFGSSPTCHLGFLRDRYVPLIPSDRRIVIDNLLRWSHVGFLDSFPAASTI